MQNPIMSQIQVGGTTYDICDLEGRMKTEVLENTMSTAQKILGEQGTAYAIYNETDNTLTFFRANEIYTSSDTSAIDIMGNTYTGTIYTDIEDYTAPPVPWEDVKTNIKKIVIADSQYIVPKSCTGWFSDTSVEEFKNISQLDFKYITDLSYMFANCTKLETLPDLSEWDTSNITNMAHMFDGCGATNFKSISKWDTPNVTNMSNMFNSSNLGSDKESYIFHWDTSSVTNFSNMFANYKGDRLYRISGWDISAAKNMAGMFQNCPDMTSLSLGQNWDTSNVINMDNMFNNCPKLVKDCSSWNVDNVVNHIDFAKDSPDIIEPNWTSSTAYAVLDSEGTLTFFRSENNYTAGTNKTVTDIKGNSYTGQVYTGVENTGIGFTSAPWFNQRTSVKLAKIADDQVLAPKSCAGWFNGCINMTAFEGAERLDTSAVTSMVSMFENCRAMIEPPLVGGWNTSNVTDMSSVFNSCSNIVEPPEVGNWDTSSVTSMWEIFYHCRAMIEPPAVGGWNISKVDSLNHMFYDCSSMTKQPAVSNWNTSAVTNMDSMFNGCSKMPSFDISKWDFSKVTSGPNYLGLQDCSALKELRVPAEAKIAELSEHPAQGEYAATWGNEERGIIGLTAEDMIATINAGNGAGTWKWEKVLLISQGGTGATTDVNARANLGVYSKSEVDTALDSKANVSHTHSADDITEGILDITCGGTGATTDVGALTNLGAIGTKTTDGLAYGPLVSVTAEGHAEQDGTPTPSDPKEIRVVRGRNLLALENSTKTVSRVTFKFSSDTTITISGTATQEIGTKSNNITLPAGTYFLSGHNSSLHALNAYGPNGLLASDSGNGASFTLAEQTAVYIYPIVPAGAVNTVVRPQIEAGSTAHPYVPYGHVGLDVTANGATTTTPIPLPSRGWVGSLPDGTHDALAIDGAGKVTWELVDAMTTFDGDESWSAIPSWDSSTQHCYSVANAGGKLTATSKPLASHYKGVTYAEMTSYRPDNSICIVSQGNALSLLASESTLADFKTWLASNPVTVLYPLATPTTVEAGYVDLPDIPDGAVVSMPELEGLGVESWTSDAVARYVRAWAEMFATLLPAGL